ncbi:uncharacterized protein LOC127363555 isoform X20 [Dicentrarchus labrax]|uniref:uncharacterized protein LOC127363555 isoform X19 n=1 Tax=Dicentrarchus labrax TaxID=13489 RepID=UPI0021F55089|nr:uncharacterized protein LOC127363555 isoform X19 [Dicentrarchus labrax]XP_051256147.1 uncharacterized protein LOC127363555 isoform X20 [Dicentrarchus labrax]
MWRSGAECRTSTRPSGYYRTISAIREKMICWILLLINLTSCVCGTFVVNVTQTSYQAEENHNITLEWTFTTNTDSSLNFLFIYCRLITDHMVSVLYDLRDGVEITEFQDEQFKGRVQCDKDVLREGRIRLHVSRLRTEDSGLYLCEVRTNYGLSSDRCRLSVTADKQQQRQPPPNQGTTSCCCTLALAVVLLYCFTFYFL